MIEHVLPSLKTSETILFYFFTSFFILNLHFNIYHITHNYMCEYIYYFIFFFLGDTQNYFFTHALYFFSFSLNGPTKILADFKKGFDYIRYSLLRWLMALHMARFIFIFYLV